MARVQVDAQIDEGLDVEVVAVGPAAQDFGAEADAREATAQDLVVSDRGVGHVRSRAQRVVDDPAVLRPVPILVYIPLRIQSPPDADARAGRRADGRPQPGHAGGV